ncbi:MAG: hypothetical protein AABW90_04055 [Nanoarchaeota archaeon]
MVKWYFASRRKHEEKIKILSRELNRQSHEISYDRALEDSLVPYHENSRKSAEVSYSISQSIKDCVNQRS